MGIFKIYLNPNQKEDIQTTSRTLSQTFFINLKIVSFTHWKKTGSVYYHIEVIGFCVKVIGVLLSAASILLEI